MELCEKQKEVLTLIIPFILGLMAFIFGLIKPYLALILPIVVDVCMITYFYLRNKRKEKEQILFTSLNENVFEPWLNISKYDTQFHIEIPLQENIDSYWIDEAKSFLELKKKKYGIILELKKKIECLQDKYNCIGKDIKKKINEQLSCHYPSLKSLESQTISTQNCYVINNVIFWVWYKLKRILLKCEYINLDDMHFEEKFESNVWKLRDLDFETYPFIHSDNQKDIDKKQFMSMLEKLISEISESLTKLNNLEREIEQNLEDFRKDVKNLSNDIELNRV